MKLKEEEEKRRKPVNIAPLIITTESVREPVQSSCVFRYIPAIQTIFLFTNAVCISFSVQQLSFMTQYWHSFIHSIISIHKCFIVDVRALIKSEPVARDQPLAPRSSTEVSL